MVRSVFSLIVVALAAACSQEDAAAPPERRNPAVAQALNDPLMTDPDLSSRNEAAAAITVRTDGPITAPEFSPEAIASARAEAAGMLGDTGVKLAPSVGKIAPLPPGADPAAHLASLADKTPCKAELSDSTLWAARLPDALPVYPRGATLTATGGEGAHCRVVAVRFAAPVPRDEVLAFYWQRAKSAGLAPSHLTAGDAAALRGGKAGFAFDLRARASGEYTIVDLATVTG